MPRRSLQNLWTTPPRRPISPRYTWQASRRICPTISVRPRHRTSRAHFRRKTTSLASRFSKTATDSQKKDNNMNITPKQRKALWICLAIVVGCYFARSVVTSAMQMQYYQRQAVLAAQRKREQVKAPAPAAPISPAPAAEPPKATAPPADKAAPPADTLTSLPTPAPIPP